MFSLLIKAMGTGLSLVPDFSVGPFAVRVVNSAALLNIVLLGGSLLVLVVAFNPKGTEYKEIDMSVQSDVAIQSKPDMLLVIYFLFSHFILSGTLSVYETIITPMTDNNFNVLLRDFLIVVACT